jgi:hypothetical protein
MYTLIEMGKKIELNLHFKRDVEFTENPMPNKLLLQFFKSKTFIDLFNNNITPSVLEFVYKEYNFIDGKILLPPYILKLKKNDVKSVVLKGSIFKVKIVTTFVKNSLAYYKHDPKKKQYIDKRHRNKFIIDKDYNLNDMVDIHIESYIHYLKSGGLIDQIQYLKNTSKKFFQNDKGQYDDVFLHYYKHIS